MQNKLRIIGGVWRSRIITFMDAPSLRPTPARVRETLFNWLQQDIMGSHCLDLFAGSGALGFEAASRGANKVTLVDTHSLVCQKLRANAELLKASQVQVTQMDALQFLTNSTETYDVVFLDPPFADNCVEQICQALVANHKLKQHAKIYVEISAHSVLQDMPEHWQCLRHKIAGEVAYYLLVSPS